MRGPGPSTEVALLGCYELDKRDSFLYHGNRPSVVQKCAFRFISDSDLPLDIIATRRPSCHSSMPVDKLASLHGSVLVVSHSMISGGYEMCAPRSMKST